VKVPGRRTRKVTLDPGVSLRTLRSETRPGRSLPGPDASHPLYGAGSLGAVPMVRNIRGMNRAISGNGG
jgi:hypothetical protein